MLSRKSTTALTIGLDLVALATPAAATLQISIDVSGDIYTFSDSCNAVACTLALPPITINGVTFFGVTAYSSGTAANPGLDDLIIDATSIIGTSLPPKTITITGSDTNFLLPAPTAPDIATLSGFWVAPSSVMTTVTANWYYDPANEQGANPLNTPGVLFATYSATLTGAAPIPVHFGGSFPVPPPLNQPFSLTIQTSLTDGEFLDLQTKIGPPIPEPSTWAMMLIGFVGLGFVGWRASRKIDLEDSHGF
jgi:hypothetical protein